MRTKLFLSLTLLSLLAAAQGRSQDREVSLDAARKEGIVSWYSTLAVSESQPLAYAFEKIYPSIKVNLYRGQAEKLLSKIATEARAGHYLFDVLTANDIEFFVLLKQGAFAPRIPMRENCLLTISSHDKSKSLPCSWDAFPPGAI